MTLCLPSDSRLQKIAEDILGEEIQKMADGEEPYVGDKYAPLAERGAAVVIDVNTGESFGACKLSVFRY